MTVEQIEEILLKLRVGSGGKRMIKQLEPGWEIIFKESQALDPVAAATRPYALILRYKHRGQTVHEFW